jgi:SMC interacting uncharacterized protein involved in chromosome segregation
MSDLVKLSAHTKATLTDLIDALEEQAKKWLAESVQFKKQREEAAKLTKSSDPKLQKKGTELTKKLDADYKKACAALEKLDDHWRGMPKELDGCLTSVSVFRKQYQLCHDTLRRIIEEALQNAKAPPPSGQRLPSGSVGT